MSGLGEGTKAWKMEAVQRPPASATGHSLHCFRGVAVFVLRNRKIDGAIRSGTSQSTPEVPIRHRSFTQITSLFVVRGPAVN